MMIGRTEPRRVSGPAVPAPLGVGGQQYLRVAVGFEAHPVPLELSAQLDVVVDLAVEHHPDRLVLVRHRLVAALEVDDRQPAEAERGAGDRVPGGPQRVLAAVAALVVGAAVPQQLDHPLQRSGVDGPRRVVPDGAGDAAHVSCRLSVVGCQFVGMPWQPVALAELA